IPFVVRDDFYPHQIVYQVPFATYHAYSAWPRQSTRYWNAGITCGNLYGGSGPDASTRSYAVSFNRPIAQYWGSGDFFAYEYPLVCWMEREGLDVAYITSVDVDRGCPSLDRCRLFVSGGHDEYWSGTARRNVEALIGRGVAAAFMGGNPMYWQTRYEDDADHKPRRRLVCYKDGGSLTP